MIKLITEDLVLRSSTFNDMEQFYQWETTEAVKQFLSMGEDRTYEDAVREYIHHDESPRHIQFTVCLKDEEGNPGEPIGRIILGDLEEGWKVEVWRIYIGNTSYRGLGYGKQALRAVRNYCFEELGLERVYLDHYTGNPAAFLYKSLGFKYEGVLRNNCRKNGKYYDVHLMSILREEYFQLVD